MLTKQYYSTLINIYYGAPDRSVPQKWWTGSPASFGALAYYVNLATAYYGVGDYSSEADFISGVYFFTGGGRTRVRNDRTAVFLAVGSGSTEAKIDDFKLETWIPSSDLQVQNYMVGSPSGNDIANYILSFSASYMNVSDLPITVSEIGLVSSEGRSGVADKLLLAREVLNSPVTVQPGETYTFTMVLK